MTDELRETLLRRYGDTQARIANPGVYDDVKAPWSYYDANYAAVVAELDPKARIAEIGSGSGSLLAWLRARGFSDLHGVDASPADVEFANGHLEPGVVTLGDAASYLDERAASFDAVFAKAIVEHIPRQDLLRLLRALSRSLRPGGRLIVDVPNMDWILASHERYMDLTHENGFTMESLSTYLALEFEDVRVTGSRLATPSGSQRLLRPVVLLLLRRLLYFVGEGASDVLFSSRSLIAVARAPRPAA